MNGVAVVGLGNIGLPLALNLMKAGYSVQGFDIRPCAEFEQAGGCFVVDIAQLDGVDVVIQSLPTVGALTATVDALLKVMRPGQVVVDISSYALEAKQGEARRLREKGIEMLDCEVSGLPPQVAARTAVIFKAGDQAIVDRLVPLFDAMAEKHFYLGSFGAATKMKLIANMMVCANNLMAAEALNLGAKAGLDPGQMIKVLGPSAAGSMTFVNKAPLMLEREFANGRGPFRHMFGYLRRAAELAGDAGAATPMLAAISAVYALAEQEERHDQDIAAIIEIVEKMKAPDHG